MNTTIIILFVIFVIIFLCKNDNENFYIRDPLLHLVSFKPKCKRCNNLAKNECGRCLNCGWCIDKYGNGKCVSGDEKGSYDIDSDCKIWRHPSRFYRYKPRHFGRHFL
jgi:hypothetical protein